MLHSNKNQVHSNHSEVSKVANHPPLKFLLRFQSLCLAKHHNYKAKGLLFLLLGDSQEESFYPLVIFWNLEEVYRSGVSILTLATRAFPSRTITE